MPYNTQRTFKRLNYHPGRHKQGCLLSSLLFKSVLDVTLYSTIYNFSGILWGMTQRLYDLDYSDDICFLSHSHHNVQGMLTSLSTSALIAGLIINHRSIFKVYWSDVTLNTNLWIWADQKPIEIQIIARKWN